MVKDLLEGHYVGEVQLAGCHIDLEKIPESQRYLAVLNIYNISVEHERLSQGDRVFAGQVCSQWISTKTITTNDYLKALKEFLEPLDDLRIDIPKIWWYIAEIISNYIFIYTK